MEPPHVYSEEDWLAHSSYGIGQIKGIEVKSISGAQVRYFRIQTTESTYWVPVDQMESEKMRPISTPEDIQLVIAILQRPPREMSSDHKIRKNRIQSVQLENTLEETARLIRDMRARQLDKGKYNMDENSVIRTLKQRLVEEWSIIMGNETESVAKRLDMLLVERLETNES